MQKDIFILISKLYYYCGLKKSTNGNEILK